MNPVTSAVMSSGITATSPVASTAVTSTSTAVASTSTAITASSPTYMTVPSMTSTPSALVRTTLENLQENQEKIVAITKIADRLTAKLPHLVKELDSIHREAKYIKTTIDEYMIQHAPTGRELYNFSMTFNLSNKVNRLNNMDDKFVKPVDKLEDINDLLKSLRGKNFKIPSDLLRDLEVIKGNLAHIKEKLTESANIYDYLTNTTRVTGFESEIGN